MFPSFDFEVDISLLSAQDALLLVNYQAFIINAAGDFPIQTTTSTHKSLHNRALSKF